MPATPVADLSFDTTVFPDPFSFDHQTDNAPAPIPLDPPKPKKPRVNHTNLQRALVVGLKSLTDFTNREIEAALGIETRTIQKIYKKARDRGFNPDQRPLDLDEKYILDGERTGRPRKNPVEPVVLDVPAPEDEDAPAEFDYQGPEVLPDEGQKENTTGQQDELNKEGVGTKILSGTAAGPILLPTQNSVPVENIAATEPVAAPKKRKRKDSTTPATRLRAGKKGTQVPGNATDTGSVKETPKRARASKKDTTKTTTTTTTTTVKRARTTKPKKAVVSEPVPQMVEEEGPAEGEILSDTGADEDAAILQQLQAQLQAENGSRMNETATKNTNAVSRGRGARTMSGGGADADGDVAMAGDSGVEPFNYDLSG